GGWYTIFIWYTMLAVIGYGHEEWVRIGVGAGHEATPRRDHRRTAATRQQARGARSRRRARRQSGAGARRAANTRDRGTGYPQAAHLGGRADLHPVRREGPPRDPVRARGADLPAGGRALG